ncbi:MULTISPECIES: hypothetical protein [unclassified Acidovorax]|uniref:hypothetical protein n=1 Tax=unclassified Acidovorax TaxID=2684926 RepID=UPI001C45693D|nr:MULTISPECIES: hypothetical protein [unclassified Acidovorax]MBV7427309.1 hypothetical protein [Acidovorax sp. sif0732]MBV7448433.1 hypothetical protein [Acidovorax sp. sif0715]
MLRTNLSQEYDCPHGSDSDINEPNLVHHGQKFYCHWCGGEHIAGIDVQVSTIRDWRDYPALPQSAEELQALINEDDTPKITDQELQALRKKVATYEARDALGLVPQPTGELGPDGKEWAKTAAGYAHVEAMLPRADGQGIGPFWYGWALRGAFVAGAEWQETRQHPAQQAPHPDDAAVDRFAAAMKAKLASARAKGRGGWENKDQCQQEDLALDLRKHVNKGDPVDVANFAMMLHQRGESTKLRPLSQDLVEAIKNAPVGAEVIEHNGHPIFITRASDDGAPMLGLMESNHKELQAQVVRTANLAGEIELRMCNGAEVPQDLESGMVVDVLYTPASSEGSTT